MPRSAESSARRTFSAVLRVSRRPLSARDHLVRQLFLGGAHEVGRLEAVLGQDRREGLGAEVEFFRMHGDRA